MKLNCHKQALKLKLKRSRKECRNSLNVLFRFIIFVVSYLGRERVSIDGVLAADAIVRAEVQMNLVKLITITERTAGDVDGMASVVLHGEHDAMTGVRQNAVDSVLVQMKRL